jgi:hypothetical protein
VLLILLAFAALLGSEAPPAAHPAPPLVGFSYSPALSASIDHDPVTDLSELLEETEPDLVRLPVYWDSTQPSPDRLDFSSVDELLGAIEVHNESASRQTEVVLTIGARNFLYPELHSPAWSGLREQPQLAEAQAGAAYRHYFESSIERYRSSPLLYAWQVENEPFDLVPNALTGPDQITEDQLGWEIDEVHLLDPGHRAVTTSYDGWSVGVDWLQLHAPGLLSDFPNGHPAAALEVGDALGLDIYVDGPTIPVRFASVSLRTSWKADAIAFWADQAARQNKSVWLAEMQAQPWGGALAGGFTPDDLIASATAYRQDNLEVVLLWGVETWLQDPAWMRAAVRAIDIFRD